MTSPDRTITARLVALSLLTLIGTASPSHAAARYTFTDLGPTDPNDSITIDSAGHVDVALAPSRYEATSQTAGNYVIKNVGTQLPDGFIGPIAYFGANGQSLTELAPTVGPITATNVYATGINASGTAVGTEYNGAFYSYPSPVGTAISYSQSGGMQLVAAPYAPTHGISYSAAYAINDAGQIVGAASYPDTPVNGGTVAFLTQGQQSVDLNTLIAPGSGWLLTSATGIDDAGQIVGIATNSQNQLSYYLLTPIPSPAPEPGTLVVMAAGGLALGWRRPARGLTPRK